MKFSLIICTYMRPKALLQLLKSVRRQSLLPLEIIIVDGSMDRETEIIFRGDSITFQNRIKYFLVDSEQRGLTKQRNFGISKVNTSSDIICFLDDDTVLESDYFENLLDTYNSFPDAVGVGGYIVDEIKWEKVPIDYIPRIKEFFYDGWKRKDSGRFILRKRLNLDSNCSPGFCPLYSHGRSLAFLPPSNQTYQVEQLMGGVSSFRKSVFENFSFSTYFEGYGLYEDSDFCLRVAKKGKLYVNTNARLNHYHEVLGRPNQYKYGKMVVRNGWYVWRIKNPNPDWESRLKWNAITILLTLIRFGNIIGTENRKAAFTEAIGRSMGWCSLLLNKPKLQ